MPDRPSDTPVTGKPIEPSDEPVADPAAADRAALVADRQARRDARTAARTAEMDPVERERRIAARGDADERRALAQARREEIFRARDNARAERAQLRGRGPLMRAQVLRDEVDGSLWQLSVRGGELVLNPLPTNVPGPRPAEVTPPPAIVLEDGVERAE